MSTELLPMKDFYVEINHQKKKWLLCCSYNPNKNAIKSHLEILHKDLALYSSKYENLIILGYFIVGMGNSDISVFCDTYRLKVLLRSQHTIKTLNFILINNPKCFPCLYVF